MPYANRPSRLPNPDRSQGRETPNGFLPLAISASRRKCLVAPRRVAHALIRACTGKRVLLLGVRRRKLNRLPRGARTQQVSSSQALTNFAALRDKDSNVRMAAAHALGTIGPDAKSAIPALEEALGNAEVGVRRQAAIALGRIGAAQAVLPPRGAGRALLASCVGATLAPLRHGQASPP